MTTDEAAEMAALPTQLRDDAGYLERVAPGGWYIEMANRLRRAATFIERSTAPTGEMVMVPREPTLEMVRAGNNAYWNQRPNAEYVWRAMLSSSPHPTPEGDKP